MKEHDATKEKIMEVLREYGELNATRLARLTGLHYRVLLRHLMALIEQGYVEERRFGRLRLFRIKT